LNQILGCGWDGGAKNAWSLRDAGVLYEAIANGTAVPSSARSDLLGIMLGTGFDFAGVVNEEASTLGLQGVVNLFLSGLIYSWKDGAYRICDGSCPSQQLIIRDRAGILTLPVQGPKERGTVDYVWGAFIANGHGLCESTSCAPYTQTNSAIVAAVPELSRPAIHAALQTWASVTTLAARPAVYVKGLARVAAILSSRYGTQKLTGQVIRFRANGKALCSASTGATGVAVCTAKPPKGKLVSYTATFAGTATLFPATVSAPLPPAPKKK
jgi:hypothetical protein